MSLGRTERLLRWVALPLALLSLAAAPGGEARAGEPSFERAVREFEEFAERMMVRDRIPGLAAAFMKDGFVWVGSFGLADVENETPLPPDASFRLASITKPLTAIAVLQLYENGKIDLDAEVQTYVPDFPKKKWPVTVRLLLGHMAGISHYRNVDEEIRIREPKTSRQALAIFQDFDLVGEPGAVYNYSSYGYNLLGAVIEAVSRMSYGEYLRKHIFEPLEMSQSRMDSPHDLIPKRVRGYRIVNGRLMNSEYVDISSRFAGGGARSTMGDLMKFARGVMTGRLLKDETTRMMFASMALTNGRFTGYGMGWSVMPWRGRFQVSHGGNQPETRTQLVLFPIEGFAVAMAANLERSNLMPYIDKLAELAAGMRLEGDVYATDRERQAVVDACSDVFSHGLSQFLWQGRSTAASAAERVAAFAYFNRNVAEGRFRSDYAAQRIKAAEGIHPVSNAAFVAVGSFMAEMLHNSLGGETLTPMQNDGPAAFFSAYIRLYRNRPDILKAFRFERSLERLILKWDADCTAARTEEFRALLADQDLDLAAVTSRLKDLFRDLSFRPDFSERYLQAAQLRMDSGDFESAARIMDQALALYPRSPSVLAGQAMVQYWRGDIERAGKTLWKARIEDPFLPLTGPDRLVSFGLRLAQSGKIREAVALAEAAAGFHPGDAHVFTALGDFRLRIGRKEGALEAYRKALELDPSLQAVAARIKELEDQRISMQSP
jgi:CubicO group peptidase (beta-lactamase class C family)/Tfp pilus assembly protein PilF